MFWFHKQYFHYLTDYNPQTINARSHILSSQIISPRKDYRKNIGNNTVFQHYRVFKQKEINFRSTTWSLWHNPILPGEQTSYYNHQGLALEKILFKESNSQHASLCFHSIWCPSRALPLVTCQGKQAKEQKSHTVSKQLSQNLTPNMCTAPEALFTLYRFWG